MFFNKPKYRIKKAFSMVELMMLLVIASLIVAASVPIVTKKHLHLPSAANHGTYMCYYHDGHLYEARRSGRINQKMLAGYPRKTSNCVFDPPAKASLFQITAIGGGGGGGDAGYTGTLPTTYTNTDKTLYPFGLTIAGLEAIGIKNTPAALAELKSYMGHIWSFAESADSGNAGPLSYTSITTGKETHECPLNQQHKSWKTYSTGGSSVTLCAGYTGQTTVSPTSGSTCYAYDSDGNVVGIVGGTASYGGASATCSKTEDVYDCLYPYGQYYDCEVVTGNIHHPAEYSTGSYISGSKPGPVIPCSNPCIYKGQSSCNSGPCYGPSEDIYSPCAPGIPACKIKDAWDEPIKTWKHNGCENDCVKTKTGTKTTTWTETASGGTYGQTSGKTAEGYEIKCDTTPYGGEYQKLEYDGTCNVDTTTDTISYGVSTQNSPYSVGHGKFCTTPSLAGDLGLGYSASNTVPASNAPDGPHINEGLSASMPYSFCNGIGVCGTSTGSAHTGTSATSTVGPHTITAESAPAGAVGNTLRRRSVTLQLYNGTTADAILRKSETFYYDEVVSTGHSGTDGRCVGSGGEKLHYDCRKGASSSRIGYCLMRHYHTAESQAELSGLYKWHDTYDENTLKKGFYGKPGEFKTIVVRSLNGIDRTINVGRGGSAATINLGKNGSKGSDTTFGNILTAQGGDGGVGSQPAPEATGKLPPFNKAIMDFNKLKTCMTTNTLDSDTQCKTWKNNPSAINWYRNTSGEKGAKPSKTSVGGMFSFVLSSFEVSFAGDDVVKDILEFSGKGGNGGGVEHFCWAGQNIITFEDRELIKSSVYHAGHAPAGADPNNIIPVACKTSFRNIPATPGYDGALIITW